MKIYINDFVKFKKKFVYIKKGETIGPPMYKLATCSYVAEFDLCIKSGTIGKALGTEKNKIVVSIGDMIIRVPKKILMPVIPIIMYRKIKGR